MDPDAYSATAAVSCAECLKLGHPEIPDPDVKEETKEDDPQSFEFEQIMVTVEEGEELKPFETIPMKENRPQSTKKDDNIDKQARLGEKDNFGNFLAVVQLIDRPT